MTVQADIDALIRRADTEYRTVDKGKRAEFAGVTAMAGLTILAKHIDAIVERLDGASLSRTESPADVQTELTELRKLIERLTNEVRRSASDAP